MKRNTLIWLMLATMSLQAKTARMNIQDAVNQRKIRIAVESLGGHQGFCLNLTVQNLTKDSLIILVEAGRRMVAADPGDQDILLVKDDSLRLRRGERRNTPLKGYCCQASDRSPSAGKKYSVGGMADSALCALARLFSATPYGVDIEQHSIWAVSDQQSTSSIPFGEDSCAKELRKFVSLLKNEPVPWYATEVTNRVYRNGVMEQTPRYVSGSLAYGNPEECYGAFMVLDSAGRQVAFIRHQWLKPGPGQLYRFRVPVAGLPKGTYYVQLSGGSAVLARREFRI